MNPENTARLLDLRSRCLQADTLRREGKTDLAESTEPSDDEIREALIALRNDRSQATAAKTKKAEQKIPMNLNDLFSNPVVKE